MWILSPLSIIFESLRDQDLRKWSREFVAQAPLEAMEIFMAVVHGIWIARKKVVFEDERLEPNLIASRAISILHTYQKVNKIGAFNSGYSSE